MHSLRSTRSTVLGKRTQQDRSPATRSKDQLQTPESTPDSKRRRTSLTTVDGDGNKENIPPFKLDAVNAETAPASARTTRTLRRTRTEVVLASPVRQQLRRRASASTIQATPTRENTEIAVTTPPPTPPTILLPFHARVKALLRSTCNTEDMCMVGRTSERATIQRFLDVFVGNATVQDDEPTSLFISGSPGTGKTALVNSVIHASQQTDLVTIVVNCMTLKTLDALKAQVIEELQTRQAGHSKKSKVQKTVKALLKSLGTKCLLVLDELDHIAGNWDSLGALFSLFESASLRVIGIANTHTLTSESPLNAPSHTIQTLHFAPYTPAQLQEVIQTRLAPLRDESESNASNLKKLLSAPALMLLTKRVANLTGDVRSLFEVLRAAIDLAVSATKAAADANPLNTPAPSVSPPHILAALKAYAPATSKGPTPATVSTPSPGNSEIISKIRNLGLQSRIVLLSILLAAQRAEAGLSLSPVASTPKKATPSTPKRSSSTVSQSSSSVGFETQALFVFYNNMLDRNDLGAFDAVSRSDFGDLINVLEGVGLVQLSCSSLPSTPTSTPKAKRGFGRTSSFGAGLARSGSGTIGSVQLVEGVWTTEVLRGLGISDAAATSDSDLRNEEVKALWTAESNRVAREVKALATAAAHAGKERVLGFEDAFER